MTQHPQKPILLTGASGKLGRMLAKALAAHGWRLRLTDISPFPDPLPPGAEFTRADLEDGVTIARLAEGSFTQQVIGTRFRVNVSPDLQVNTYIQYDNSSNGIGTNTRMRWTFSPLGDLFVVYNHNMRELLDPLDRHRGYAFGSNQLQVKLQYAFRY